MARKAKPHDEELPFVALMDTMTNVVGVLIIVLVMIGIGLAKSVQKVLSDLPMVSVEEHKILKDEMGQYDAKRDPAEVELEIAKLQGDLKKVEDEVHALEGEKSKNPNAMIDLDKLTKELEAKHKDRDQHKVAVQKMLEDIEKLKIQLDNTPHYQPPPPMTIRLPSPRPLPPNANINRIFVSEGKLFYLNNDPLFHLIEDKLKDDFEGTKVGLLKRENLKGPDGKPLTKKSPTGQTIPQRHSTFDPVKLSAYFDGLFNRSKPSYKNPNHDVMVKVVAPSPNQPTIQMQLTPRPEAGELPNSPNARLKTLVSAVAKDPQSVIWFHVSRDSIAAYHMAREIIGIIEKNSKVQIPVGWEIMDKPLYTQSFSGDYMVPFKELPPAPPPPPGTPAPTRIAAPKAALD
jgi:hypothetical protein